MSIKYPVYAHTGGEEKELLEEHVERCKYYFMKIYEEKELQKIVQRFSEMLQFKNQKAVLEWMLKLMFQLITFHDVGKCNPNFQKIKMENNQVLESFEGLSSTRHSFLSSLFYLDFYLECLEKDDRFDNDEKKKMRVIIWEHAFLIARHHSNLEAINEYTRVANQPEELKLIQYLMNKSDEPKFKNKNAKVIRNVFKIGYSGKKKFTREENNAKYFYYRLLYSLLVACDYHATTEYMTGIRKKDLGESLSIKPYEKAYKESEIYKNIRKYEKEKYSEEEKHFENIKDINELRSELFLDAEHELKKHLDKNLFFLEAPTGSGKSNTAFELSFHLMEKGKKLFYIYPYNTLVEQNQETLNKLFQDSKLKDQIVVVNSLTPISVGKSEYEEDSTEYYQKALLDRQFLNYPIILSTHVSFFNLLFGSKKEDVFGFFQLSNAVIVLDEIQSYRNSIWSEIIIMLKACAKLMGMKIIIMSATLPNLEVLTGREEQAVHLIKKRDIYYQHPVFRDRVRISFELLEEKIDYKKLLDHIVNNKRDNQKILLEFIKKDSAYTFYQMLLESDRIHCPVKCITGDDSIYEREKILRPIKDGTEKDMILVSTQVVEAGVDIDMDVGYKNISLLDSEEQFLGRINRSCKGNGIAYFFYLDSWEEIYRGDFRQNKEFTLKENNMREILKTKNFKEYYNQVFQILHNNLNENTEREGLETFFRYIKELNFPEISNRMQLIKNDNWSMDIVLCRRLKLEDQTILDGEKVWNEYKTLLQDQKINYAQKQVKLSEIRSKLKYFTYRIKKNAPIIYNDILGELRCIYNGEDYFKNGKLDKEKFVNSERIFI